MCIPLAAGAAITKGMASTLSIINTVASVGSAAVSYLGQVQEAATQNAAYAYNKQAANDAANTSYSAALQQANIAEKNEARQRNNAILEGMRARGTALASSQNEGNSTELTLKDLMRQSANDINIVDENAKIRSQQTQDNLASIQAQAANRIGSVGQATSPSILNLAISGIGAYAGSRLSTKQFQYSIPQNQTKFLGGGGH